MPEKISAAAVKVGERVFTGETHMACLNVILQSTEFTPHQRARMSLAGEDGFVTNIGRFVTREEGFEIAKAQGQMITHPCADDPAANMAFYGGTKPRLDSGLIREYAKFTRAR
jgi:hypothetical protein